MKEAANVPLVKRQSTSFLIFSWLPVPGNLALIAFYFLAYTHVGINPTTNRPFEAASMGYYPVLTLAISGFMLIPLFLLLWLIAMLLARTNGLLLGRVNVFVFVFAVCSSSLIFLFSDYAGWLMD